jgi:hypothetical protein
MSTDTTKDELIKEWPPAKLELKERLVRPELEMVKDLFEAWGQLALETELERDWEWD